jgi:hypothetical protein
LIEVLFTTGRCVVEFVMHQESARSAPQTKTNATLLPVRRDIPSARYTPKRTTNKKTAKNIFVDAGEPAPEDFELEELSFLRCSSTGNRTLVSRDLL